MTRCRSILVQFEYVSTAIFQREADLSKEHASSLRGVCVAARQSERHTGHKAPTKETPAHLTDLRCAERQFDKKKRVLTL